MKMVNVIISTIILCSNVTFSQGNSGILPFNDNTEKVEWSGTIKKSNQSKSVLHNKIAAWGISRAEEVLANDNENGILKIKSLMPFNFKGTSFYMLYSTTLISYNDSIRYNMTDCILLKNSFGVKTRRPFELINRKDKDFIKPFHEISDKMDRLILELKEL